MKILLTLNKTYRNVSDTGHAYVYTPLQELGHEVYWYDTVDPEEKDYDKIIEDFKPDLIFCCMTGNHFITPYEPWNSIKRETVAGRIKTFNWFCDDTWRFDNFSKGVCEYFTACSTPEPDYIKKYKDIGYENIILGCWHANSKFYPRVDFDKKERDISFIGNLTPNRRRFFDSVDVPVENIFGVSIEELFISHSNTKMGVNLSTNDNDPFGKTQMKGRMFEIPAGAGLLVTEHHDAIENFYELDEEIITFKTVDEFNKKVEFLLKRPKLVQKLAWNGYQRFLKDHDSKVRLKSILKEIEKI